VLVLMLSDCALVVLGDDGMAWALAAGATSSAANRSKKTFFIREILPCTLGGDRNNRLQGLSQHNPSRGGIAIRHSHAVLASTVTGFPERVRPDVTPM
jgi:hypothetical protein